MYQHYKKRKIPNKNIFFSLVLLGFSLVSCKGAYPYTEMTVYAADTFFNLRVYGRDEGTKRFTEELTKQITHFSPMLDAQINNIEPIHEIALLNENRSMNVSDRVLTVLKGAVQAQEETNGLFSPFLLDTKSIVSTFLFEGNADKVPNLQEEIEIAKNTSLAFEGNRVTIVGDGNIDLGGIGKGGILESLKDSLKDKKHYLINGGNSSILLGEKDGSQDGLFRVELQYSGKVIALKNTSISTSAAESGVVEKDGVTYSHIVNPLTGSLVSKHMSVTVIGPSALLGDAYSTACMNMELEDIKSFLEPKGYQYIVTGFDKEIKGHSDTIGFVN